MAEAASVEKLHDGRLWIITVLSGSHDGVDAWEAYVREYIAVANSDERYLVYDTTGILNLGFTRYLQQRATILAHDNRDARGRVAIVLNLPVTIRYFFETFVNFTGKRLQAKLDVKLFKERHEAIAWVAAALLEPSNI